MDIKSWNETERRTDPRLKERGERELDNVLQGVSSDNKHGHTPLPEDV